MGGMVAAAAISAVGAYASNKAKQKADKRAMENQMAMTAEESRMSMERTAHEMALEDYYNRRDRWETQRGLDQFRQFSTVREFMPNFQDTSPRIEEPTMPAIGDYATGEQEQAPQAPVINTGFGSGPKPVSGTTPTSPPAQRKGGGIVGSLMAKSLPQKPPGI